LANRDRCLAANALLSRRYHPPDTKHQVLIRVIEVRMQKERSFNCIQLVYIESVSKTPALEHSIALNRKLILFPSAAIAVLATRDDVRPKVSQPVVATMRHSLSLDDSKASTLALSDPSLRSIVIRRTRALNCYATLAVGALGSENMLQ